MENSKIMDGDAFMVFYTPLDFDIELYKYKEPLNMEFDGRKYDDIVAEIGDKCPHIYTQDELHEMCKENLTKIQETYGFRGVRVWYHSAKKNLMLKNLMRDEDGWGGDDPVERKYYNLIPHIWNFHNDLLFETDYFLNVMLYYRMLEEVFYEMYGDLLQIDIIDNKPNELYHIVKAVHMAHYDIDVINSLLPTITDWLWFYNCQYYLNLDLTIVENMEELYLHLAEENYDEDAYEGFTIFHSNDGWGNVIFDKWEHWTDEDGRRCSKLIRPKTSINDYNPKGSIY